MTFRPTLFCTHPVSALMCVSGALWVQRAVLMAESRALSSSSSRLTISNSVSGASRGCGLDRVSVVLLFRPHSVHGCSLRWQLSPWSHSSELLSAAHSTSCWGSTYSGALSARSCSPCQLDLASSVLLSTPRLIGHSHLVLILAASKLNTSPLGCFYSRSSPISFRPPVLGSLLQLAARGS